MYYAGYRYHVSLLSQFECVDIDGMYMHYYSINLVYVPRWFAVDIAYVVIDPLWSIMFFWCICNHESWCLSLTSQLVINLCYVISFRCFDSFYSLAFSVFIFGAFCLFLHMLYVMCKAQHCFYSWYFIFSNWSFLVAGAGASGGVLHADPM